MIDYDNTVYVLFKFDIALIKCRLCGNLLAHYPSYGCWFGNDDFISLSLYDISVRMNKLYGS